MWCRINPKRTDAKRLREIFLQVMSIHTKTDRDRFLAQVNEWEQKYGHRFASLPETKWVFSDLKRARSMLLSALSDMFHYLDDSNIPKSTNALEGYFSGMKKNIFSTEAWLNHIGIHISHGIYISLPDEKSNTF